MFRIPSGYQHIVELGAGGMAEACLACARGTAGIPRLVVVKRLRAHHERDADLRLMFADEARLATLLNHPNIVHTNEIVVDAARTYIVMEYVEGHSLVSLYRKLTRRAVPLAVQLQVLREVLAALEYAHEVCGHDGTSLELVHRDISPQNVLVTYDGHVKLIDFGVASSSCSTAATEVGLFKGKLAYASPEQIEGTSLDRRSDLFSVGVLLREAVLGERITTPQRETELARRRVLGEETKLASMTTHASADLVAICDRAMAREPDDRFGSAAEMRAALETLPELAGSSHRHRQALGEFMREAFAEERKLARRRVELALAPPEHDSLGAVAAPALPAAAKGGSDAPIPAPRQRPRRSIAALAGAILFTLSALAFAAPAPPGSGSLRAQFTLRFLGRSASLFLPSETPKWPASSGAPCAAPSPPAPIASTPPIAPEFDLTVTATPSYATIFLDDQPLPGNPFVGTVPASANVARLRVEAPGFSTQYRTVELRGDIGVVFDLRPLPTSGAQPPPAADTATAADVLAPTQPILENFD